MKLKPLCIHVRKGALCATWQIAREREVQIILSTHSPYILAELPPDARIYLMDGIAGTTAVTGGQS